MVVHSRVPGFTFQCQQSNEYQRRYEEQVILKKELQRETADLRMALRHTQNGTTTVFVGLFVEVNFNIYIFIEIQSITKRKSKL